MDKKLFKFLILILLIFISTVVAVFLLTKNAENNILPKQTNEIIIKKEVSIPTADIPENKAVEKKEPIKESPIQGPLLN